MPLSFIDDLQSFTDSEVFRTGTDFLKQVQGYRQSNAADALANKAYNIQLDAFGKAQAAEISSFQFNTVIELENLATQLDSLRLNRDAVISNQRAELAARGLTSSRSGLAFINETLSRGEQAAMDLRIQSQNRRRASELELGSVLAEIDSKRVAAGIHHAEQARQRANRKRSSTLDLIQGGLSVFDSVSGLFGGE